MRYFFQAFPKFVEILYKKGFGYKYVPDHHITPFWIKCRLCYLNYSYIGKMETFQQDVKFIANKVLHRISLSSVPRLTTGLLVALVILYKSGCKRQFLVRIRVRIRV